VAAPAERTDSDTPVGPTGIEKFGYTQELKRSLSTADLVIYGLIFMVPIAPFAIFGTVFSLSGGMVHVRRFSQMSQTLGGGGKRESLSRRAVTSAPPSWRSSRRAVPGQTRIRFRWLAAVPRPRRTLR
jgi:hypothetical protein